MNDALDIVGNMVFETNAKYGLFENERVGYIRQGWWWVVVFRLTAALLFLQLVYFRSVHRREGRCKPVS